MPRTSRMVPEIDTEDLKPKLVKVFRAQYGEDPPGEFHVPPQVLLTVWADDEPLRQELAVVNTEGVGLLQSPSDGLVRVYVVTGRWWGMTLAISPELIVTKKEKVDFAQFVRTFGDRLENNWALWERKMTR